MSKIKRNYKYLRFLCSIRDNWDFNTRDNTGIYKNKVRVFTSSGDETFTKEKLEDRIEFVKKQVKGLMDET